MRPHAQSLGAAGVSDSRVPAEVRLLLRERVHSFEQLEALMLLHQQSGAALPARTVGQTLRIPEELAEEELRELAARELVVVQGAQPPLYRYGAASDELAAAVGALAREYADNRLGVVKLMSANAIARMRTGAIRAFSDAFLIKRKPKDG